MVNSYLPLASGQRETSDRLDPTLLHYLPLSRFRHRAAYGDGDAQRIGQLAWMLFLKIFDQCEEAWEDDAADRGETYVSPLPEECRWRNWAAYDVNEEGKRQPKIAASDLIKHVNDTVFPGLQNLIVDSDPKAKVVRDVFEDTNNYMKAGTLMLGVIDKLDEAVD